LNPPRSVLRFPAFRRWLYSDAVNLAGSSVSTVVLPLLVYERTGSPALTAGLAAQATSVRVSLLFAGGVFGVSGIGARLALRRGPSRP